MLFLISLLAFGEEVNWENLAINNNKFQKVMLTVDGQIIKRTEELEATIKAYDACQAKSDDCNSFLKKINEARLAIVKIIEDKIIDTNEEKLDDILVEMNVEKNHIFGNTGEINLADILNEDFELNEDAATLLLFIKEINDLKSVLSQKKLDLKRLKKFLYVDNIKKVIEDLKKIINKTSENTKFNRKYDTKSTMKTLKNSSINRKISLKYKISNKKTW
jgi:hypothetical protein